MQLQHNTYAYASRFFGVFSYSRLPYEENTKKEKIDLLCVFDPALVEKYLCVCSQSSNGIYQRCMFIPSDKSLMGEAV